MKKVLLFSALLLSVTLSSCTTMIMGTKYNYSYQMIGDSLSKNKQFKDDKIDIRFDIGEKQIEFSLKNLTNDPMKISWDEAALIQDGISKRVIHKGIRFIEKDAPQAPSMIPPLSEINELLAPTDKITYSPGYYSAYSSIPGGWTSGNLYLMHDMNREDYKKIISENEGKVLKVFLPIECNGLKFNYTFSFKISVSHQ